MFSYINANAGVYIYVCILKGWSKRARRYHYGLDQHPTTKVVDWIVPYFKHKFQDSQKPPKTPKQKFITNKKQRAWWKFWILWNY